MSEEDQNRRRLERAGWAAVGDFSLSLLLLLKKGLFLREVAKLLSPNNPTEEGRKKKKQ